MKNFFKDSNWIMKVVAFATAFTVLYDFVKDLGELAVHIYHFIMVIVGSVFAMSRLKKNG
jgi:hypothetical protein